MIHCTDVVFGYENGAQFHTNLHIQHAQITLISGANGSGKSTLLKLLAGVIACNSGVVQSESAYMVFPEGNLFPGLTVHDNLGIVEGSTRSRVEDLLNAYDIPHLAKAYPHELSSGQSQLVALLRVFLVPQMVVLLDEPFNYLSGDLADRLMHDLAMHAQCHKKTLVVVSHQQEIVKKYAHTCLFIHKIVRYLS